MPISSNENIYYIQVCTNRPNITCRLGTLYETGRRGGISFSGHIQYITKQPSSVVFI